MDYLDPEIKKKHTRQLFVGYGLMAVLIGLATTLLVLLTLGFSFDRSTGTIIQNGLVFVDTNPIAANVYVNGELRGRGDQRLVLPSDSYEVSIEEPGYRTWSTQFSLRGGTVERFSYPFLFAEDLMQSVYRRFPEAPAFVSTSPDRRWLLLQESSRVDAFVVYDLSQPVNLPTFFSLPVGVISADEKSSSLEVVEWSNDNRHVLINHTFEGGSEYVLVNRQEPGLSQNITSRFSDIAFTKISLIDKQFDSYHLFDDATGVLYEVKLQLDDVTVLLENIATYRSHGSDNVLFVQHQAPEEVEGDEAPVAYVRQLVDDDIFDITELQLSEEPSGYLLDLARFDGSWFVVAGTIDSGQVLLYKNPVQQRRENIERSLLPFSALRTEHQPVAISFSANARNIMLQSDKDVAVYDAEREQTHRFVLDEQGTTKQSFWMDGHRIIYNVQGTTNVVDFTGDNRQSLIDCDATYRPVFDGSYAFMYCVAPHESASGGALTRTSLRVPPTTRR